MLPEIDQTSSCGASCEGSDDIQTLNLSQLKDVGARDDPITQFLVELGYVKPDSDGLLSDSKHNKLEAA